jgi:hypothetical protein
MSIGAVFAIFLLKLLENHVGVHVGIMLSINEIT